MKNCRLCYRFIWPGEEYTTQLVQSASGSTGAANDVHVRCLKTSPASGSAARRGDGTAASNAP